MRNIIGKLDLHPASVAAMLLVFIGPLLLMPVSNHAFLLMLAVYINIAALTFYDFREFRLPNILNASFFLIAAWISYMNGPYAFEHHILGALAGAGLPLLLNAAYKYFRGRQGIGMGDIKLLAGSGMLLGWPELPLILSISSTLGIAYVLIRFGIKKVKIAVTHIPFGPFIGFATIILWLLY